MADSPCGGRVAWRLAILAVLYCWIVAAIWWIPLLCIGKSWREPADVMSSWLAGLRGHVPRDYPYLTAFRSVCIIGIIGLPVYLAIVAKFHVVARVVLVVCGVLLWLAYIGLVVIAEAWRTLEIR